MGAYVSRGPAAWKRDLRADNDATLQEPAQDVRRDYVQSMFGAPQRSPALMHHALVYHACCFGAQLLTKWHHRRQGICQRTMCLILVYMCHTGKVLSCTMLTLWPLNAKDAIVADTTYLTALLEASPYPLCFFTFDGHLITCNPGTTASLRACLDMYLNRHSYAASNSSPAHTQTHTHTLSLSHTHTRTHTLRACFSQGSYYCMCPHTTVFFLIRMYVSSYDCMCILILLDVSSCYYMCVLMLLYACPDTSTCLSRRRDYVSSFYYICVLILLCLRPDATTLASAYY